MSEKNTGKIVTFELDLDNPPSLTDEEREQLDRLRTMKDKDIDLSDIPAQTDLKNWQRPGLFGGPAGRLRMAALKEKVLILDESVVEGFRAMGDVSPQKMNAVLLEYLSNHRKSA
ncbi:MAG: hypothetical protein P4K80_02635 [Acidobacteriaceae bacterium]|nr:hypothetical protein [Acidobacteriaceae bacterium]